MARPLIPLAEATRQVMVEEGAEHLHIGNFGLVERAYERAYGEERSGTRTRPNHPLNRHEAVIKAAQRSPLFVQVGRIRHCYGKGGQERLHPLFKLRQGPDQ